MDEKGLQFDLRAMLCGMMVISVGLAYLRTVNPAYLPAGLAAAAGSLLLGTLVGLVMGRVSDSQFWAVLGGTFGFLSAIEIVPYYWAWACTGAAIGAAVGCVGGGSWRRVLLIGSLAATTTFGAYVMIFFSSSPREILFDLAAVPMIGALFGLLIHIFFRLEQRTTLPRHVTATVLMIAVCVGNFFAR